MHAQWNCAPAASASTFTAGVFDMRYLYLTVDNILPGDTLPDVSQFPVATVTGTHVTFNGTRFTRDYPHPRCVVRVMRNA